MEETEKRAFSAQELVQQAKARAKERETFAVPFLDTEILFRLPEDAIEHEGLKRQAERMINVIQKTPSAIYKPYQKTPAEIIRQAFWLHKMAIDPPFTLLEALELNEAGGSLPYLYQSFMLKVGESVIVEEIEMIDDLKNESRQTVTGETN